MTKKPCFQGHFEDALWWEQLNRCKKTIPLYRSRIKKMPFYLINWKPNCNQKNNTIQLERSFIYQVSSSNLRQQKFARKDHFTSPHVPRVPFHNSVSPSHINTWFHWNSLLYNPGWLKGFPVGNGKWMRACVCVCVRAFVCLCVCVYLSLWVLWPQHTHTSLPYCHQLISEVTQAVSAQPSRVHDVTLSGMRKHWLRKGNKEWLSFIAQPRKKERDFIISQSPFLDSREKGRQRREILD